MNNDYHVFNATVSFEDGEEVSVTHLDVAAERKFSLVNEKNVLFISLENADVCGPDTVVTLDLANKKGIAILSVPEKWTLENYMECKFGSINVDIVPEQQGSRGKLILKGVNRMGMMLITCRTTEELINSGKIKIR